MSNISQEIIDAIKYEAQQAAAICKDKNWSVIKDGEYDIDADTKKRTKSAWEAYGDQYSEIDEHTYCEIYREEYKSIVESQGWYEDYLEQQAAQNEGLDDQPY